ncbi:c-type cytochrome [Hoeflea poritis]|uniref:Cytochrome c n=1 Tax=Hoeflea poritis TaxID=2993659 RepID=A0ABT4VTF2_9HYPH|nr:cytochrome c [Hoeflea poritis]MDA4847455.1 cytochrome c [Hoeflea poritis]
MIRNCVLATATLIATAGVSLAQTAPDVQRGRTIAATHCAGCHSIDKVGPSPLSIAPPFRTLHENYPVESLEEALVEGIVTGHPSMPQFSFDPDQASNLIAYLKTLE